MTDVLKPSRSLVSMITGSLVAAVCGVVQTFLIPHLLTVHDYGYWRAFLLYAGYAGLLPLGMVDGALLLWSNNTNGSRPDRKILGRSLRFLVLEQLALLVVALLLLLLRPSTHVWIGIAFAFATYTLFFNLLGLTLVFLQARGRFTQVALGGSLPGALFVVLLALLALMHHVTVNDLLAAYLAAWTVTAAVLLAQAFRVPDANAGTSHASVSSWRLGLACLTTGWPVVLTNTGFGLMQSADRVTVNLTRSLHDFALYSLSQSTIYVPIAILAGVSRVAFSYFARATHEDRAAIYRSSTRFLTLLWMLLLPYYFVVEWVVYRYLPRYIPGLIAGRILLLSVLFLSLIQIVQMNTCNLEGRQRQFLIGSIAAVVFAFGSAWIGSRILGTLSWVAWSQVLTAMLWWLANELVLCKRTGLPWRDVLLIGAGFLSAAAVLSFVQLWTTNVVLAVTVYAVLILPIGALLFSEECRTIKARITAALSSAVLFDASGEETPRRDI